MTEPQYTIAPLVWIITDAKVRTAQTIFGGVDVAQVAVSHRWAGWLMHTRLTKTFKTIEEAIEATEAWYRERLRPALREVEVKDA